MKFDITRKIPPFGEAYYKARKQYVLFSGILLSWKLLGFQIGEYPLPNYQISIKHPNAIQFIFVILVCYLAFRYTIEWHQADVFRCLKTASKFDYYFSHMIGFSSLVTFTIQKLPADTVVKFLDIDNFFYASGAFMIMAGIIDLIASKEYEGFFSRSVALLILCVTFLFLFFGTIFIVGPEKLIPILIGWLFSLIVIPNTLKHEELKQALK